VVTLALVPGLPCILGLMPMRAKRTQYRERISRLPGRHKRSRDSLVELHDAEQLLSRTTRMSNCSEQPQHYRAPS